MQLLPLSEEIETKKVLCKTAQAHKALAELKGITTSIPNENILIETLLLQEARESSAIENIISTVAEMYQNSSFTNPFISPAAKAVHQYAEQFCLCWCFHQQKSTLVLTIHKVNTIIY